jgi:hypothetical protein
MILHDRLGSKTVNLELSIYFPEFLGQLKASKCGHAHCFETSSLPSFEPRSTWMPLPGRTTRQNSIGFSRMPYAMLRIDSGSPSER